MGVGALLPFATWPCWECLVVGNQPPVSVASLADGYDNLLVLVLLLTLAAAATGHLANIRRRLTALVCLATALAAFALGLFDGSQPGRLFRWAVLPADLAHASYWVHPPPTGQGGGFYVFLAGGSIAIIGATVMVMNLWLNDGLQSQSDAHSPLAITMDPSSARRPSRRTWPTR
jgi:hypothetical protein